MITDALVLGLCAVITGWAVYRTRVTISMNKLLNHELKNSDQHVQGLQDEVEELEAENQRLREELSSFLTFVCNASGEIKWRRVDKDSLEFTAELEAEVAEQCRLNAMGQERELRLLGRVERLEKALEDVEGFLRNDKYDTRVRNALSVIDDALDG